MINKKKKSGKLIEVSIIELKLAPPIPIQHFYTTEKQFYQIEKYTINNFVSIEKKLTIYLCQTYFY